MTDFWNTPIEFWHLVVYVAISWSIALAIRLGKTIGKKDWQKYEELKKRYDKHD